MASKTRLGLALTAVACAIGIAAWHAQRGIGTPDSPPFEPLRSLSIGDSVTGVQRRLLRSQFDVDYQMLVAGPGSVPLLPTCTVTASFNKNGLEWVRMTSESAVRVQEFDSVRVILNGWCNKVTTMTDRFVYDGKDGTSVIVISTESSFDLVWGSTAYAHEIANDVSWPRRKRR